MFGYDKVKDIKLENDTNNMTEFVKDLEEVSLACLLFLVLI